MNVCTCQNTQYIASRFLHVAACVLYAGVVGGSGTMYLPRGGVGTTNKVPWPAFMTQKGHVHHGKKAQLSWEESTVIKTLKELLIMLVIA